MTPWLVLLIQVSVIAYALLGGVFLAFSDFIMRALRRTEGAGGAAAMQAVNREVFRYVFMPLFLGMVPVSLTLAVGAALTLPAPAPVVAAGILYLVGVFGLTAARNVPMNNQLAAADPASAEGQRYWTDTYVPRWTFWNTLRAAACIAAAALLLVALSRGPGG
jgi:uncharacterized membrane protein